MLDLPGGLGGEVEGAAVTIGPGEMGTAYRLRASSSLLAPLWSPYCWTWIQ
jgi:hypothetical protein